VVPVVLALVLVPQPLHKAIPPSTRSIAHRRPRFRQQPISMITGANKSHEPRLAGSVVGTAIVTVDVAAMLPLRIADPELQEIYVGKPLQV
jgi:hypothetical protein